MALGDTKNFLISLIEGINESGIEAQFINMLGELKRKNIIKTDKEGNIKLDPHYKAGKIDIAFNGTGYLEDLGDSARKDLVVEPKDLSGANRGDLVIAKRLFSHSKRAKAKVVFIAARSFSVYVGVTKKERDKIIVQNIKTSFAIEVVATQKSLRLLPEYTLLKINSQNGAILEVLGVLDDPKMDEKISLALYDKDEFFDSKSEAEAQSFGVEVDKSLYPARLDLTHLPFCTIDPNDAKDFDDAVYFDEKTNAIYIAIADVSEYVFMYGNIDKEAIKRGFSIYFPHKSIPMLPRALSENICSLKPNVDRLVFGFKITLDKDSFEPLKEELFEAVIHSKKRYTYDMIDGFIADFDRAKDSADEMVLPSLMKLFEVTKKLREKRLKNALIFRSQEIRMRLDSEQNIISTTIEEETPSHSLIEECMLLANKAAAKRIKQGIFRTHETPSFEKIDKLLSDLSLLGIIIGFNPDIPALIRDIQAKADDLGIRNDVDKLIIKSQKQACYTHDNRGHFGLGFSAYSHFTSPIRRYSDLVLHRLLKAQIKGDEKLEKFHLENIDGLCESLSELEREADKVAWDFMDRKFARWAQNHIGEVFTCKVTELGKIPIAILEGEIKGARIFLNYDDAELLERLSVRIVSSDILGAKIWGEVVRRLG